MSSDKDTPNALEEEIFGSSTSSDVEETEMPSDSDEEASSTRKITVTLSTNICRTEVRLQEEEGQTRVSLRTRAGGASGF
jgi:hypothetical protein